MLKQYRKALDVKKGLLSLVVQSKIKHTAVLAELEKESDILHEASIVFKKSAILTQNHLADHLSLIATKALKAVFPEKDVELVVEFVERRNTTECDMWIEEGGHQFSLMESRGFGMTDIVSFALRVAYTLLHSSDNVMIIDEPFRNLSKDKHAAASLMIQELSEELGIQFIICTHSTDLIEYADKAFHVDQTQDGISFIK